MLYAQEISFSYKSRRVLHRCSLTLAEGDIVALVGLSGSGKTTLLRLLAGLEIPEQGQIELHVPYAYMPQSDLLLPWRKVIDNILLPLELEGKQGCRALIFDLLKAVGLEEAAPLYPHQLSGGMRQRVAFVRSVILNRPLLLLDEPFNAVDLLIREQLYEMLRLYLARQPSALLFVSHDYRDALALANKVYILREGHLLAPLLIEQRDPYALTALTEQIRSGLT